MPWSKFNLILCFLILGYIESAVKNQCSSPFSYGDVTNFCYSSEGTSFSWSDGYNQCLSQTINGILIKISSIEQFHALENIKIAGQNSFWLGANNFASFLDSQWHWLDGSIVDNSVVTWCPNSTYDTAIGTYCAAYDSTLQCLTDYLCSTLLPAPCVAATTVQTKQAKITSFYTQVIGTGTCTNYYGGAYANWWTYAVLLLNWFILFCFVLYLINYLNLNKVTIILTVSAIILSFMMIVTFAVLWGIQYQDIIAIPLIVVIVGCIASLLFLINVLILVSNRTRVQRWVACTIATIVTIIIESLLMLGLILCMAHCSAYISLTSTSVDKDVIAALLGSIIVAISIAFYNGILYLIGHAGQERVNVVGSTNPNNLVPLAPTQGIMPRRSHTNNGGNHNRIERATSPVDERILTEFYTDHPKGMHQYELEGRQYVVYEGKTFSDIEPHRRDLTEAMLLQERQGLREAIARVKSSPHAPALAEEIRQAESLLGRLT